MRGGAGLSRRHAPRRVARHCRAVPACRRRHRRAGWPAGGRHEPAAGLALARRDGASPRPSPPPFRQPAGRTRRRTRNLARLPLSLQLLRQGEFPRPLPSPAARDNPSRIGRADRGRRALRLFHRRNLPALARIAGAGGRARHPLRRADPHRPLAPRHARPAGRRRLRLDRGRGREPLAGRARLARQGLPAIDRRTDGAPRPCEADGAVRAGQPDRHRQRRPRGGGALARGVAARRGVGQRAGAAVPVSRLARLSPVVGAARRRRLGAGARLVSRPLPGVQRHPGGAAAPARRTRTDVMQGGDARPLTVLMTADAVGGVWNYALSLAAALPQIRFVLAVIGPPPNPAQRRAACDLANVVLEENACRLEWMAGAAADLPAGRAWLAGLARRHRADLLHVNGYAHAAIDAACPVVVVAHSDVLSWWQAVHGEPVSAEWDRYCQSVIAGLHAADRIVAPTAAVLDDLARNYGFRRGRGLVIANGIDVGAFAPGAKRPVVMAAGRLWDAAKNLAVLDAVAADLPWPVEIAGDPGHPEGGTARFGAARLLGLLSPAEMAERLAAAAIFALPARYEPFGLGILEAAACGCALVLGNIASLR